MFAFSGISRSSFNACKLVSSLAYNEEKKRIIVRLVDSECSAFATFLKSRRDNTDELIDIEKLDCYLDRFMQNTSLYAVFSS